MMEKSTKQKKQMVQGPSGSGKRYEPELRANAEYSWDIAYSGTELQTFLRQQEVTPHDGEAVCSVVKAQTLSFQSQLCHQ